MLAVYGGSLYTPTIIGTFTDIDRIRIESVFWIELWLLVNIAI